MIMMVPKKAGHGHVQCLTCFASTEWQTLSMTFNNFAFDSEKLFLLSMRYMAPLDSFWFEAMDQHRRIELFGSTSAVGEADPGNDDELNDVAPECLLPTHIYGCKLYLDRCCGRLFDVNIDVSDNP
ncbi:hypothetical protein BDZ89DRAFT_1042268 [Hymenopellis radicata]|nr:hypothetical protein BDZ89DRAFT_1042268 [Hymenopellis radicata]